METKLINSFQITPSAKVLDIDVLEDQLYGKFDTPLPLVEGSFKIEVDPLGKSQHSEGSKLDAGKDMPWLMISGFPRALKEVARVTTIGANKYTPNGWKSVPNGETRYMEAFSRHMLDLASGKQLDNGPGGIGTYHKAQMIWNLLAAFELELTKLENSDLTELPK